MLKKLITFVMALVMGLQPLAASAEDLSAAFSGLMGGAATSVSAPGRYTAGARNLFVGGSVEVRFPRTQATLFSVAPPSFNAGCQGISAHFGGFSFISGKEIEQLVKNIAQGAVGLVVNMVIKALCPMCEAVLQNMQKLAQMAAKTNIDSCGVAVNLTNMLKSEMLPESSGGTGVKNACNVQATSVNDASDWGKANIEVCEDMTTAMGKMDEYWGMAEKAASTATGSAGGGAAAAGKRDTTAERCALGQGNCVYLILSQMFATVDKGAGIGDAAVQKRILMMNLMGTSINGLGVSCGSVDAPTGGTTTPEGAPKTLQCLPTLEPKEAVALFMCGTNTANGTNNTLWADYCQNMFAKSNIRTVAVDGTAQVAAAITAINALPLMDCDLTAADRSAGANPYALCKTLKMSTVGESPIISGNGFLLETQDLLKEAVSRVRSNRPMGGDDTGRKIIALINMAPYPLYQAINAAAVYPEAGQALVDSLSLLVADHLAYAYFARFLSKAASNGGSGLTMASAAIDRVAQGMASLRMAVDADRGRLGKTLATQQMVMEEIRKVNQVIQQSVMTDQMLNMQKYANTLNTSAAEPSISGR